MKLVVVIPTYGRAAQVRALLEHLGRQTRLPDEVFVSASDPSHVLLPDDPLLEIRTVIGRPGLCAQRNAALRATAGRFDIITFFDDDFVPTNDYLERVVDAFAHNSDYAVVMGRVIKDGSNNDGVSWEEAFCALDGPDASPPRADAIDHVGAYGCNMSIRAEWIGDMEFDERLVLYGWQEDIDFTSRMRSRGRVVCVTAIRGVHLGIKTGRVSGERFGYSQVVNPIYLIRKGSVPASFALRLMARNLSANLLRSLRPEGHVDRRGRLRGNLLGLAHVLGGRVEPEHAGRL